MKKRILNSLLILTCITMGGAATAATITVNTADNTDFSAGKTNLVRAIQVLQDGDTIQFNIPGAGPHFLITPALVTGPGGGGGYPEITKNNVTIDGYSQPGAVPNTNPAKSPNNAQIKVVIDSRTGGGNTWDIPGYGQSESGMFVVSGNNFTVRGLSFLGIPGEDNATSPKRYGVALGRGADSAHINGCWFGVGPDGTTLAGFADGVTGFTYTDNDRQTNVVIGVKPGSANPRAEFNIFCGLAIPVIIAGNSTRISGNFFGVLPDGVTRVPNPQFVGFRWEGHMEFGNENWNTLIGTDGDGVNDADEGNILSGGLNTLTSFGTGEGAYNHIIEFYGGSSATRTNIIIAGNYVGVGADGTTMLTNGTRLINNIGNGSELRIGSDFDGVSDALEANIIANNYPFTNLFIAPSTDVPPDFIGADVGQRVSVRGNSLINNNLAPYSYEDHAGTRANFVNYEAPYMDTAGSLVPVLATTNVFPQLSGSFPVGINGYTTIILDVYELDPEGWTNGAAFAFPDLVDPFTSAPYGFVQGRKYLGSVSVPNTGYFNITVPANSGVVTVTANYSLDPAGTHNGRVHTGNFSLPGYMLPGGVASVGLTHVVNDVALWYHATGNYVTNGFVDVANQKAVLGNWEPYIDVVGESTFLVGFNTFADDQTPPAGATIDPGTAAPFQRFAFAMQPAAGGAAKIGEHFYTDASAPYRGVVNYRRQNGNPQRVAGDKRQGAVNFVTMAEASLGQSNPLFQSDTRWTSNACYVGANAYVTVQTFSLDPTTLVQTPLSKAFDPIYGNYVTATPPSTQPQVSRTGGRPVFLDNGNIVCVSDDRTSYLDPDTELSSFSIITPAGAVVKSATLVSLGDQWDNVAAFKGGFAVRPAGGLLYFYDNAGNLLGSVDHNASSGLSFNTGRGDGLRTAADIRSHYVYMTARSPDAGTGPIWLAAWDARTRAFVGKVQVDDQAAGFANDRTGIAVDALDRVCVAYIHKPTADFQNQIAARVFSFDGTSFTPLTHSFFPFVNYDPDGIASANGDGITGAGPTVAMTTRQICIAAKATINSTNNPAGGGNTATETTVYTVISHPAPVSSTPPTIKATKSGNNLVISWDAALGSFTLQSSAVVTGGWSNVAPQPPIVPVAGQNTMTVVIGSGNTFFRLAK